MTDRQQSDAAQGDYAEPGEGRRPAELAFAIFLTILAAVLLSQLGEQVKILKRGSLPKQPGFWPAIALGGMLVSGGLYAILEWRKKQDSFVRGRNRAEIVFWLKSAEFMVWFMVYVWLVPNLGYLLSTILFMCSLAWRAGYRDWRWFGISAALATFIVLLFKGFLSVKIPAGAIYEFAPEGIRSFLMVWI